MKLELDLENCYGINQLQDEFNFSRPGSSGGVYSLYAPNGTLKTSLAKTFKDIAANQDSVDLIYPERTTKRIVTFDGNDIQPEQVIIIDSYDESYSSKLLSTLLVNEVLKQSYDDALKEIDLKKSVLVKELSKAAGKQAKDLPEFICEVFNQKSSQFLDLIRKIYSEEHNDFQELAGYKYTELFNPKVLDLLVKGGLDKELGEYIETYNQLVSQSSVLSKQFNHQKAGVVSKSLGDNGFFSSSHSLNISVDGEMEEVSSKDRLLEIIESEQAKVLKDPDLQAKFIKFDQKLKIKDTQEFRDFLTEHQELLAEYGDVSEFKKKVIVAYLQLNFASWKDLVTTYENSQGQVKEIVDKAKEEETTWKSVVKTFNKRFNVPFTLRVDNQDEVILNSVAPAIKFDFDDGRSTATEVNRNELLAVLSQGEKRALYILNILFEIRVHTEVGNPILIVMDDIADSFDYKNKYAIVEYLKDISKIPHFNLLLLTHNFDFHRIVGSRLIGGYSNKRLLATKTVDRISLNRETYQNDVFKYWKSQWHRNEVLALASIPFARNIAEYCGHIEHYDKLTSLLHIKSESKNSTNSDLQAIYRSIFVDKAGVLLQNGSSFIIDTIYQYADDQSSAEVETLELESKILLAMAIRLKAEEYMIEKIDDSEFLDGIESNQTRELFDQFAEKFESETSAIEILDQVNLMTPENIHLNSFMYEPILDMSAQRLYRLYEDIKGLGL